MSLYKDIRGYELLHYGAIALGRAERAGIRVDTTYCSKKLEQMVAKEARLVAKIRKSSAGKAWLRLFGTRTKFGSADQLKKVLESHFGVVVEGSMDKNVLKDMDQNLVQDVLLLRKIHKARTTYLRNILSETTDGFMHPFFNLHMVPTYRSSSTDPNFQNMPIRDPWAAKLIRSAFIARPGHRLVEADYGGIEVRVAACYHQDPRMIKYLKTGYDMHREMAAECYLTPKAQVSKMMRYSAKNRFVFPEFYGSYYAQVAPDLWKSITEFGLKLENGTPLRRHMKRKGILRFSDFEDHIRKVEDDFWGVKFKVYSEWKEEWVAQYRKRGYFDTLTGFRCQGWMKKNEVINYPIQGSAFHCLLWSFIHLDKMMRRRKMKSVLIGQIHDSILADVLEEEMEEFVELLKEIAVKRITEVWDWIILPLEIEVEASPVNGSWFEKKEYVA